MTIVNASNMIGLCREGPWPFPMLSNDGSIFNVQRSGHDLNIFLDRPSTSEIADIRRGQARFALWEKDGVIFLLYRFGKQPWCDAPFSIHAYAEPDQYIPHYQINARAMLMVTLVDFSSGIVKGLRGVTLGRKTTEILYRMIANQAQVPITAAEYDVRLKNIFARYSTQQMVNNAVVNEWGGV